MDPESNARILERAWDYAEPNLLPNVRILVDESVGLCRIAHCPMHERSTRAWDCATAALEPACRDPRESVGLCKNEPRVQCMVPREGVGLCRT
jgi:hypothetical protein